MPGNSQSFNNASGNLLTFPVTDRSKIPYIELLTEYSERFTGTDAESTRVLLTRWQDREKLVTDVLGFSINKQTVFNGVTSNLSRQIPEAHPFYDWMFAMEVQSVTGVGVPPQDVANLAKSLTSIVKYGDSTASMIDPLSLGPVFNLAKVVVHYRQVDFDIENDQATDVGDGELGRFVSRYYTYSTENLPLRGNYLKWTQDPKTTIATNLVKPFPKTELSYVWHQVPAIPQWTDSEGNSVGINDNTGFTNSMVFDGWDPGTLLYLSPDVKRTRQPNGEISFEITYKFLYRKSGQNNLFRPTQGEQNFNVFQEASVDGNQYAEPAPVGVHLMDSFDFNKLFILQ